MSKLYKAYVNEIINWDLFCEYSEMLNRLFIQDLNVLRQVNIGDLSATSGHPELFILNYQDFNARIQLDVDNYKASLKTD